MNVAVLIKATPDPETRLRPNAEGTGPDTQGVKWVLGGYDESAVEQALLLKEATPDSKVRAFSFGPAPRAEEVLRQALALGADGATWVEHPAELRPDPLTAARALAFALRRGNGGFDLVLAGKQGGDYETGLVPAALAEALGVPDFAAVVDLRFDAGASRFRFRRALEGGSELWECPPPLVVGLQEAWNDPRTAKLQNILKSRRAPIDRVAWTDVQGAIGERPEARPTRFRLPPPRTGAKMIEFDSPEDAARKLVRVLKEEAKVFP
jgi:electron transfer flavoprotein beta subunit